MNTSLARTCSALGLAGLLVACGGGGGATPVASPGAPAPAPAPTPTAGPPVATAQAVQLDAPWGLAQLPDGSWLVTQRTGGLVRVSADFTSRQAVSGAPAVATAVPERPASLPLPGSE